MTHDVAADLTFAAALADRAAAVAQPARLAALRAAGVLDTEAEEAFDRLTRLAVRLVGVPAAFVSLVDADRDFYKSACGFGEPLASARELAGPTFCHETVRRTTPLVIPDTAADPAYRAIPTVRTLGVAAYVGVPLLVGGHAVGAFCVIDARPRAWTDGDLEVLTALAASAERELELRAAARSAEAERAAVADANGRLKEQQLELEAQAEALQEASANMEGALADAMRARREGERARGDAEAARARTASVLESTADAYLLLDADFRVVTVNGAMERGSGLARTALLGGDFWTLFPGALGTAMERHYRAAALDRVEAHFTHDYSDGRLDLVVEVDAYPAAGGGVAVFWRDVTARARAEAALRTSESRYRALFDALDQGFCVVEILFEEPGDDASRAVDYRFVEANHAFTRQSGLAEPVGRTALDLVPGLDAHWVDTYAQVARTGEATGSVQGLDATGRWYDVYAFRVGAPEDHRVAILFTDVSASKAAERERERLLGVAETLRAEAEVARARLSDVFQQAPAFIAVIRGPDHVFELANRDYYQLVGHRDVLGRPVREALPEVVEQGFVALLDRVLATGEPFHGREVPILLARTPGAAPEERFVTFVYQALVEADGSRSGVFAHGIDVTDSVLARQAVEASAAALAASEARYRTLTEAVPVQVWTARPDGQLDLVSERTTTYFGASNEQVLGSGWGAFVHPDDLQVAVARWSHALATGAPYQAEFRLRAGATGEYRWHLARALAERDAGGAITGWVGTNTDVEDERHARAEAEAARRAAEAANQAKADFLATMSHELRTPLNAIGGYAELLEMGIRGPVTDEQRLDLARIQQSQRHLLGLVNEVLDLAKVDAGALRVESAAVRAGDTVDAALALVRPQAAARALALSDACAGAADRAYLGDEPRVRQVLVNLLSNAVKFTDAGGRVSVACALTEAPPAGSALTPGAPYVGLRVEDTGVGIPDAQRERIFEPFTQVENGAGPYARQAAGTGLGLAISRRLARLMGGDLTVESTPGVGSAFTLWLPTPERRAVPRGAGAAGGGSAAHAGRGTPERVHDVGAALARIGSGLAAEAGPVVRDWVARLRGDPGVPAAGRTDAELEDHAATFVTDIGLGLRAVGTHGADAAGLLRDSRAILTIVAERHGAQRARLGWTEAALRRELAVLDEVLGAAVGRLAGPADGVAADRARLAVAQFLGQAERVSLGGLRLAAATIGAPA